MGFSFLTIEKYYLSDFFTNFAPLYHLGRFGFEQPEKNLSVALGSGIRAAITLKSVKR